MSTGFASPPAMAAWRHCDSRDGFEVARFEVTGDAIRIVGATAAVVDGEGWIAEYELELGPDWITRRATVGDGTKHTILEHDGAGAWTVDGEPAPELAGIFDADLEASSLTNAFPVHRLGLTVGEKADAPAVWVRASGLACERLEQRYERMADGEAGHRYAYAAPDLEFETELEYDAAGLVLAYPGIARRAL
jgi:hypothetical protein